MSGNHRRPSSEGNWKQFKGEIQEKRGDLTRDDLDKYEGRREQLEGHIQEQTGEARESVHREVDRIARETKYRMVSPVVPE